MTRARRDHDDDDDETPPPTQREELTPPANAVELRWIYSPGHVHLEIRHAATEPWQPVPYVRFDDPVLDEGLDPTAGEGEV